MTDIRPANRHHRRQMVIDAVAELNMAEVHRLVTEFAANINDLQVAISQTERDHDEVFDAYTDWLDTQARTNKAEVNKVRNYIAQGTLFEVVSV